MTHGRTMLTPATQGSRSPSQVVGSPPGGQSTRTRRLLHRFTYFFVQILSPVIHTFTWDRPRGSIPKPEARQKKVVKKIFFFTHPKISRIPYTLFRMLPMYSKVRSSTENMVTVHHDGAVSGVYFVFNSKLSARPQALEE